MNKTPPVTEPLVLIVDDDSSFRAFLSRLVSTVGLKSLTFATADEFLRNTHPDVPSCLILDVQMPGLSGLDLQRELRVKGLEVPIVFITGHGDIPMTVQAMKAGAVGFLAKPFRNQDLLDAIREGINLDTEARRQRSEVSELRRRFESLTPREREVMAQVVTGLLNKQIGGELGMTERTVKAHRAQVMLKMQAGSVADLVRMSEKLGGSGT